MYSSRSNLRVVGQCQQLLRPIPIVYAYGLHIARPPRSNLRAPERSKITSGPVAAASRAPTKLPKVDSDGVNFRYNATLPVYLVSTDPH